MVKLYFDPGHGGSDPGASGNGFREKDLALQIALEIRSMLKKYKGAQVRLSRTTDKYLSLSARTNDANKWGADYFLSIHLNAFNGSANGYEDFIYNGLSNSSGTAKKRDIIHDEVYKAITSMGSTPNRGRKKANFAVLRQTDMPAMLSENLFIDGSADGKIIKQKDYVENVAQGHVNGLAKAFNLKKRSDNSSNTSNSDADFLKEIKPGALKGWSKYGILPSISGAQAILESAWGKSSLAVESNNLFGVKASADWKGRKKAYKTKEQDSKGNETTITAYFRVYDSWADSVEDHGQFFTSTEWRKKNYSKVPGVKDYAKQAQEIQNSGYATDIKYADKLIGIIESNNLQAWDKEVIGSDYKPPKKKPSKPNVSNASTYTVKSGDNLSSIAKRHGTTTKKLQNLNNIKDPNLIHPGQKLKIKGSAASSGGSYTIKSGDTLSEIAQKNGTTTKNLQNLNGIKNANLIKVGQKIKLPGGAPKKKYHTVKSGDTVSQIAVDNKTTTAKIKKLNGLKNADFISVGQKLRVK